MSFKFEFNAPQFLNKSDDPDADRFFDANVDIGGTKSLFKSDVENHKKQYEASGIENRDPSSDVMQGDGDKKPLTVRKVLCEIVSQDASHNETQNGKGETSTGSGKDLIRDLENLKLNGGNETCEVSTSLLSTNEVTKQNSTMNSEYKPSASRKSSFTFTSLQKRPAVKRQGSPYSPARKFISLAERIQHFHYDTPDRFRSKPKHRFVQNVKQRQTIPRTPVLAARYRHRPVNFPNEKEREEQELNEMKKHQIKAHPLNEKILKGPVLNLKYPIEKRQSTVPEPFKLTEMKIKEHPQSPVFVFKAQPVPITILNGTVGVPPKKVAKTTVPVTPNIRVPVRFTSELEATPKTSSLEQGGTVRTTKIQPFSFDYKIKEQFLKKEEIVKKVLEEEKKGFNSFKANPLPSYLGRGGLNGSLSRINRSDSIRSTPFKFKKETETKSTEPAFKAKPASVIHQKPFVPVLAKHETPLPEEVNLNTQRRAIERQKFDEKIKKKEEMLAQVVKERMKEEERLEQQKKLEERKLTEFKANPIPKYKPFQIIPSDLSSLTFPKTPKCLSRIKKEKK